MLEAYVNKTPAHEFYAILCNVNTERSEELILQRDSTNARRSYGAENSFRSGEKNA